MTLEEHALAAMANYFKAHAAWKDAADEGQRKAAAKVKQKAHSAMLAAAELYEKQLAKPEHR